MEQKFGESGESDVSTIAGALAIDHFAGFVAAAATVAVGAVAVGLCDGNAVKCDDSYDEYDAYDDEVVMSGNVHGAELFAKAIDCLRSMMKLKMEKRKSE